MELGGDVVISLCRYQRALGPNFWNLTDILRDKHRDRHTHIHIQAYLLNLSPFKKLILVLHLHSIIQTSMFVLVMES